MKSHLISDVSELGDWVYTLCGKMLRDDCLARFRTAQKCKKCKNLLKKEWYVEL